MISRKIFEYYDFRVVGESHLERVFTREDVVLVLFLDESTPTLNTALKSVSRDLDLTYGLAEIDVTGNIKKYFCHDKIDLERLMCNFYCVTQCEKFVIPILSLRIYVKLTNLETLNFDS